MIRAFLVTLCLLAGAASAATIDPRNAKYDICGRFELWHINGIMTNSNGATLNLDRIQQVYGNAYNGHLIVYRVAFNQTRGFTQDFLNSAKQVIAGYAGATWDKWMNAVTFGIYSTFMSATTAQAVAKKVTDLFGFTKPSPYQDADLTDITNAITAGSAYGARIMLAPHSQG
ncbi:MAG TPA: hypothetical protein VES94_06215, partial [Burkholderiales bacterium]|nr:hypothetical protein [Burkholderiales bacterium]